MALVRVRVHVFVFVLSDLLREEEAGGGVVAPPRDRRKGARREAVSDTEQREFAGLCTRGSHPSDSGPVAMPLLLVLSRDVYALCGRVRRNTATGLRLRVASGGEDMCTNADDADDADEVAEEENCDLSNDDAFSDAGIALSRLPYSTPPPPSPPLRQPVVSAASLFSRSPLGQYPSPPLPTIPARSTSMVGLGERRVQ